MDVFEKLKGMFLKETARTPEAISAVFQSSGGTGLFSGRFSFKRAVSQGYKDLVWVNRCISKKADSVASVPWVAFRKEKGSNEYKPLDSHPIIELIEQPNRFMGKREMFSHWMTDLDLGGNSYWELVTNTQKRPIGLWRIRPDWMKPIPGERGNFLQRYELQYGTQKIPFKIDEIIHMKYIDPVDPFVGMSLITAASRTIETENAAIGWNKTILDNSGVPNGVLKVPVEAIEHQERSQITESIEEEFTDEKRHRPLVLWGGLDWEPMSMSQKDMDFMSQRKMNKWEICSVLGVPAQVVGADPEAKYANYQTARLSFWEDTIVLLLDWIRTVINTRIVPLYGDDSLYVSYDLSEVPAMREAFTEKIKSAVDLWRMGFPINAINERLALGMPQVDWGDVAWMPMNLVPAIALPSGNEEDEDTDDGGDTDRDEDLEDIDPYSLRPGQSPKSLRRVNGGA